VLAGSIPSSAMDLPMNAEEDGHSELNWAVDAIAEEASGIRERGCAAHHSGCS
jgi:hypothetical protein